MTGFRVVWRTRASYPVRSRVLRKSDFLGSVPLRVTALYWRISREYIYIYPIRVRCKCTAIYETWHLHSARVRAGWAFQMPSRWHFRRTPASPRNISLLAATNAISAFDTVAAVPRVRKTPPRFAKCGNSESDSLTVTDIHTEVKNHLGPSSLSSWSRPCGGRNAEKIPMYVIRSRSI